MDDRPFCKYGDECYRKNEDHFKQYQHDPSTKKAKPSQLTVTVVNRTEFHADQLSIEGATQEMRMKGAVCVYGRIGVKAGESATIELKGDYNGVPMTWHCLSLRKKGLRWASAAQTSSDFDSDRKSLVVEPGGSYDISVDESCRPLTEAETLTVTQALFDALEHCVAVPEIWQHVAEKVPASLMLGRTVKQLSHVYQLEDYGHWRQWYKPITPAAQVTAQRVASALSGNHRIEVYYRALDRFPGGNADIHTVCYRFSAEQGVVAREHSNWDGNQNDMTFRPPELNRKLKEVMERIEERVLDCARHAGVDSDCTLLDMKTMDNEEYDTEWTSFEVLLMVPLEWSPRTHCLFPVEDRVSIGAFLLVNSRLHALPRDVLHKIFQALTLLHPQRWLPVFRLHQLAIPGIEQCSWMRAKQGASPEPKPPSASQQALIDCVHSCIGMGRVNQFSDAGDGEELCEAAREKQAGLPARSQGLGFSGFVVLPYLQPHFFRSEF